jgi:hypothetical protein
MPRITGLIYSLDLGVVSGFAKGRPGDAPVSGSVRLKAPKEGIEVAHANLIAFLQEQFAEEAPALLVKERIMSLEAFKQLNMGQDVVYAHAGYHAIVAGMCGRYGIPWEDVPDSTARKHFIGKGRLGNREATKAAVIDRCHVLGLMPKDCRDDNRADALCNHDFACATYGGRAASIGAFQLFAQGGTSHAGSRKAV